MCQFFTLDIDNEDVYINLNQIAALESHRYLFSTTYTLKLSDGTSYELRKSEGQRLVATLKSHSLG